MEVKEDKLMVEEKQRVPEKMIPVFTVLKNGAILKNIFIVNTRDHSSPERNGSTVTDDGEVEEILVVGRHPDCDILLTHPSISRFHLEIRSISSCQRLFVTDLSSVHGTWVRDLRVEPHACVEVEEGDTIRIGGSTRIYRLHWIPLSRAYDFDNPFVSPLDASTVIEQDEENRVIEAENLESLANTGSSDVPLLQSLANTGSSDAGDLHLEATSEGTGSSVPSEDEDTSVMTREISLPLASSSVLTLARDSAKTQKLDEDLRTSTMLDDVIESVEEELRSSCIPSKQQSGGYMEGLGCSLHFVAAEADECDGRGDGGLHPDVMSERMQSSVSNEAEDPFLAAKETSSLTLPTDSINLKTLWLAEGVEGSPELSPSNLQANAENPSGCSPQIDGCFDASVSSFELPTDVVILSLHREVSEETEFLTREVMEASAEPLTKVDVRSHRENGETEVSMQVTGVSTNSLSQGEPTLEVLTDEARGFVGSEDYKESEVFTQVIAATAISFSQAEPILESLTHGVQGFLGSEFLSEVAVDNKSKYILHQESTGETKAEIKSKESYKETAVSTQVITVSPNSFSQAEPTLEITHGAQGLLGSEFLSEVEVETEIENLVAQKSNEETKANIRGHEDYGGNEVSRQLITKSPNSFSQSQSEPTLETFTEEARGLVGSEFQNEVVIETESENLLHQTGNGETMVNSWKASAESDCMFSGVEPFPRFNKEDIQSLCSSWQPLSEVMEPSEIWSEANPAGDENQKSGMTRETEKIFDVGSSSCRSEDLKLRGTQSFLSTPNQKPNTESLRSERYYSLSEIEDEENTDKWCPIPSILSEDLFEDTKTTEVLSYDDDTGTQENQTPQTKDVSDDVLSEMNSSSACNIWSRRGKAASVLQILTNKSEGKQKQIGRQPKDKLHKKQAPSDKSVSLNVHHGAEHLEPEIFTPDKENLTPSSHMLKRLQDIGDVKGSKSALSLKLSGKSCSPLIHGSIGIATSEAFTEPEIFTPDKENLTPNSHMLKRLHEFGDIKDTKGSSSKAARKPFCDIHLGKNVMAEQKLEDLHNMSRNYKVNKHEPVAGTKKAERAPFQPLLEKSSSQRQYTEASSTASERKNISRGIRSSSILSDGKSKMKWTIVLDTSSLLDKESRKPLHLLQGLKGTHLVVPRTVLRELNEVKHTGSLLYRRRREIASSALEWIEECKVNTKGWIQIQSPSEERKANAPTPPVTPQSYGSAVFPFSLNWSNNAAEISSPTSEDQVLECALLYKKRNSNESLVILSNDTNLKIDAMAEGVICETPDEFYESLVNPFSERFMWKESAARGRTWSHVDDVVLRERYNNGGIRRKSTYNRGGRGESGGTAKGLKLILLHNSHYGHTRG